MQYWLYQPGKKASLWNEFKTENILGIGWDNLGDLNQFNSKDAIAEKLKGKSNSSKKNDATANWDFYHTMQVGDIVIVKKGRRTLLGYGEIISDYYYDPNRQEYTSIRQVKWIKTGEWTVSFDLVLKTLTNITKYESEISNGVKFYDYLLSIMNENDSTAQTSTIKNNEQLIAKNQILYGPPGTGKTYKLKDEYFKHFIIREISQTREQFLSEFVSTLTWWQIITIVLLDLKKGKVLDIHNHELIQAKEQISSSKTVRPTIWGQLQSHTVLTCEYVKVADRAEPLYFYKNAESYWTIIEEELKEKFPEAYNLYDTYINHEASPDVEIHNYDFVTFHQSFSYEDFVEGIKPVLDDNTVGDVKFRVEDGVFKRICEKAKRDPSNNYALFIDEINRGNVSAIFGELITLIEESKRIGSEESLEVTLPYSKEKFSVPSNLYIIGTMNTADRSVEALDTALRRRFVFEEMLPKPDLKELDYEVYGYKASAILKRINLRIEKLVDRDHCIGHAYFIGKNEETIIDSFYKNIIPLLQEYFFGDYGKIGLILGKGFVRLKKSESALFADFSYEYKEDLENRTVYEIIDYRNGTVDVKGFGQAIAALMKNG